MKPLSKLLTCILSVVKTGLQSYCDTSYSKDMLEYIQSRSLSSCNSIKTIDFSTLYTTIPHSKLKDKLRELLQLCFIQKNGQRRYKYLVLGKDRCYFVKKNTLILPKVLWNWYHQHARVSDWQHICYVWWTVFQQTVGIPMVQTVILFSPTCSFIHTRQISYRGFSRKMKRS